MLFLFQEKALEVEHKVLIPELTFSIEDHEHLAIVGVNGVGKSTLLKVIHQDQTVDSAMMEQDLTPYNDWTVMDYIIESYPEIVKVRSQLNHTDMINKYIELDGYLIEGEIVTEAKKLGIKEEQLEQKISTLSGGEQTKVSFLKVKMSKASLLLIDEPTNHMDLEMKEWLTKAFKQEQRAILFVSHDRTFLNETPDAILELSSDGAKKYIGKYDKYKQQKDIEHETLKLQYEKQQKEQAAIEETIKKYKAWYQKAEQSASVRNPYQQKQLSKLAKRFKSKEQQLNRKLDQEHIANPNKKEKNFSIQHHDFKSHYLVQFNHVSFAYDNRKIFEDVSFYIKRNQNVIIEGRNGTGKSTLIKLILGELEPTKGNITVHPELEIGYFSQDFENLNMHNTVLDEILEIPEMKEADARTILASFYFDKDRINDVVETLSMGEKCRLQFVKLYFSNPHIMILDEPTNYFDIGMQEKIIQLIQSFQGLVLIVSHDDYFKSQIKDQIWTIKNHQMMHENVQVKDPINTESMKHQLKELEQYTEERNRETEF